MTEKLRGINKKYPAFFTISFLDDGIICGGGGGYESFSPYLLEFKIVEELG